MAAVLSMPAAIVAGHLLDAADRYLGWVPPVGVEGARTILTALASAMLTFIVFVFSMLLLTVQLASAQLTPRFIAYFYRGPAVRWSLCLFVFVFTFDLVVLVRMETAVPALSAYLATFGTVAAIGVFLFMIEKVAKSLRPVSVLTSIGRVGHGVLTEVYPHPFSSAAGTPSDVPATAAAANAREIASPIGGVVLALDVAGLAALGRRTDCTIEAVPQVGDFVASGDALFRVHGGATGSAPRSTSTSPSARNGRSSRTRPSPSGSSSTSRPRPSRQRSTTPPRRCSRSTSCITCFGRPACAISTRGASVTRPVNCASCPGRRTGRTSLRSP